MDTASCRPHESNGDSSADFLVRSEVSFRCRSGHAKGGLVVNSRQVYESRFLLFEGSAADLDSDEQRGDGRSEPAPNPICAAVRLDEDGDIVCERQRRAVVRRPPTWVMTMCHVVESTLAEVGLQVGLFEYASGWCQRLAVCSRQCGRFGRPRYC